MDKWVTDNVASMRLRAEKLAFRPALNQDQISFIGKALRLLPGPLALTDDKLKSFLHKVNDITGENGKSMVMLVAVVFGNSRIMRTGDDRLIALTKALKDFPSSLSEEVLERLTDLATKYSLPEQPPEQPPQQPPQQPPHQLQPQQQPLQETQQHMEWQQHMGWPQTQLPPQTLMPPDMVPQQLQYFMNSQTSGEVTHHTVNGQDFFQIINASRPPNLGKLVQVRVEEPMPNWDVDPNWVPSTVKISVSMEMEISVPWCSWLKRQSLLLLEETSV
jgi:hypothetical protein